MPGMGVRSAVPELPGHRGPDCICLTKKRHEIGPIPTCQPHPTILQLCEVRLHPGQLGITSRCQHDTQGKGYRGTEVNTAVRTQEGWAVRRRGATPAAPPSRGTMGFYTQASQRLHRGVAYELHRAGENSSELTPPSQGRHAAEAVDYPLVHELHTSHGLLGVRARLRRRCRWLGPY